jgi:hypothetical protein
MIPPDAFPLDLVARALIVAHRGETEAARALLHRLDASLPEWRDGAAARPSRFRAEAIASRIARDLAPTHAIAAAKR